MLNEMRQADVARGSWPAPENGTPEAFVLATANSSKKVQSMKQSPVALRNDWFTKLTGFSERSPNEVRENIAIRDCRLSSKINDQSFQFGCLEIASLRELRERVAKVANGAGKLQVAELVGDAKALHADSANAGAVFRGFSVQFAGDGCTECHSGAGNRDLRKRSDSRPRLRNRVWSGDDLSKLFCTVGWTDRAATDWSPL